MAELKIKYFGPIRKGLTENNGFINFTPVTVFIGDQATGKSTVAKLYSTFNWLEKALIRMDYDRISISNKEFFEQFLSNQRLQEYLNKNTEIVYKGNAYIFTYKDNEFSVKDNKKDIGSYIRPKIMYQPAERNLLAVLENVENIKKMPVMLSVLFDEYKNAVKTLASKEYTLPISGLKIKYDKATYRTSVIAADDTVVDITDSSSGVQSVTPLVLVSDYLSQTVISDIFENIQKLSSKERDDIKNTIRKTYSFNQSFAESLIKELNMYFLTGAKQGTQDSNIHALAAVLRYYFNQCFINIIEEPEQNLYPASQNRVLYKLLEYKNRNNDNQLIITTHSPYILSYLILCAKGFELSRTGVPLGKISRIVPGSALVSGNEISIYETDAEGEIYLLKPYENLPSDENLLNKAMAKQNDDFAKLLELEEEYCR